jgi:DNA-directed RNA polymerase
VTRRNDWARVALVKDKKSRAAMRRAIRGGKMWLPFEALTALKTVPLGGKMWLPLAALTALETVPLAISEPLLKVALQMAPTDIPESPRWLAECRARQEKVPQWRIDASKAARQHVKACRKLTSYNLDMTMAEMLVGQPFVTPFHFDFRGRVYASTFFNFQRADHVRGLIQFADGARVGQEEKKWLMAHVAARADSKTEKPSRLNFEERIAWTERNIQRIRAIGDAVRREVVPVGIDQIEDPIQFIAACHELARALDDPTFETRLPLTFDCSCSGLQHISAMTRDEIGARYSNLIPSDAAEDFYRDVARRADELLSDRWYVNIIDKDAARPDEPNEWLRQILTKTAGMPAWQAAAEFDRRGVATPNGWRAGMVKSCATDSASKSV